MPFKIVRSKFIKTLERKNENLKIIWIPFCLIKPDRILYMYIYFMLCKIYVKEIFLKFYKNL